MKHPGHMYGGFVPSISEWGMTMNQPIDLVMMTTTGFRSPSNNALNYRCPLNIVPTRHPKSLFSILTGKQGTRVPGDNLDENKVLVCYPNLEQILAGLSNSTKKYTLTILLYGITKE
jgi:hypothetical protein